MLIPENGKWRWNDGPLCNTKDEAMKTAKSVKVKDGAPKTYIVDGMSETLRERTDEDEK